ncbi:MAG: aspartyl protease family protein [Cyclobacteriaceae bacterium]
MKYFAALILSISSAQFLIAQEYPIIILEEGHILVGVTLNDSIQANFILDTGAGAVVLSSKTFDKIARSAEKSGFFTGFRHDGDRLDGELFKIPSIKLGSYEKTDILTGVYPPLDNYGIDGLISLKFFEDQPFTIDYKNSVLRLISKEKVAEQASNNTVLPISLNRIGEISLDMNIIICVNEQLEVSAEFDTGSGHGLFLVNPYFMKELGIDSSEVIQQTYTTPISGRTLTDYVFSEGQAGICSDGTGMKQPLIFREGLIYEALIGSGLFKEKAITIDISGKQFIIVD